MMEKQPNLHSPSFTGVCCKIKNFKPFWQIKSQKNPPTDMPEANFTNEVADFAFHDSHRAECRAHKPPQFNTHKRPAQTDASGQQGGAYSAASIRVLCGEYSSVYRRVQFHAAHGAPPSCRPPPHALRARQTAVPCSSLLVVRSSPRRSLRSRPVVGTTAFTTSIAPRYIPYDTKTQWREPPEP